MSIADSTVPVCHPRPVSFLMGLCDDVPGFEWVTKCLTPDRIAYVGLRDVDEGEQRILKEYGITAYSMTDVDRLGIHTVMEEAMRKINPTGKRFASVLPVLSSHHPSRADYLNVSFAFPNTYRFVHLSFDVDGIDPSHTPSTGTAVQGGLNYREARYICEYCHQTGLLKSMDIVEVNPLIGSESEVAVTAKTSVDLAAFALGRKLLK
jgi:arginase